MTRRASVPPADELFRKTTVAVAPELVESIRSHTSDPQAGEISEVIELRSTANRANVNQLGQVNSSREPTTHGHSRQALGLDLPGEALALIDKARVIRSPIRKRGRAGEARPTGRTLHEEKITVYVSPEELIDLEQAKLALRANHGLAVDRGRIVREATALVVADLEARGEDSVLVRRLRGL